MKKQLLAILVFFALLFHACQPNNPNPSNLCGNVNIVVDGLSLSYNPAINTFPPCDFLNTITKNSANEILSIMLEFKSLCNTQLTDYQLTLNLTPDPSSSVFNTIAIGTTYSVYSPIQALCGYTIYDCTIGIQENYITTQLNGSVGNLLITSIDDVANTISGSGEFSIPNNTNTVDIIIDFIDIPINIITI